MSTAYKTIMIKYRISRAPISWPRKCVACGAVPTKTVRAQCSIVTAIDYYGFFVRTTCQKMSIEYPVCSRHKWVAGIAGKLSERNPLNLVIGVIFAIFTAILLATLYAWLINGMPIRELRSVLVSFAIILGPISIAVLARRLTPAKLNSATKEAIVLSFVNDGYAEEFEAINKLIIKTRLKWWQN